MSFASTSLYWPPSRGCIFKHAGLSDEEYWVVFSSLHSNMSACGAWWRLKAPCYFSAVLNKNSIWKLVILDYAICNLLCRTGSWRCNNDTTAMITIFCSVVLSVIQGIALNTGVLPFSKGRALQPPHPRYHGVRQREWGTLVAEITNQNIGRRI